MRAADSFDSAVDFLDDRLRTALLGVDSRVKESAYEIRLRAARPVVIVTRAGSLFVYKSGRTGSVYSPGALAATPAELQASFSRMCGYSVHSNSAAAASGFISLAHGHRAGVCGTAVVAENGAVKSFRDISSVNLRIAHEVPAHRMKYIRPSFLMASCLRLSRGLRSRAKQRSCATSHAAVGRLRRQILSCGDS